MNSTNSALDPDWLVLPHQPIQELSDNLWRVEGSLPRFSMKRVMTVARLHSGGLLIHSAIALEEASMKRLEAFGTPAIMLIPHIRHRMDAPRFKRRYPSLRIFAPPGALAKARAVVPVDGSYADVPPDPAFSLELLAGTAQAEGALIVHSKDGTSVVLNEVVFDLDPPKSAFARAALKFAGFGPGPRVTPVVKIEMVKDRAALAEHLRRLAALPDLVRLIVSHSRMSAGPEAAHALREAASSL